jgi:hypothetical protein
MISAVPELVARQEHQRTSPNNRTSRDANFDANAGNCGRTAANTGVRREGLNPTTVHAGGRSCTKPCGLKIRFGVPQVRVRVPPALPRNPHKSRSESLQLSGVSAAESPTILALYPNLYPNLQLLPTKDALHRISRLLLHIRQHVTVQVQGNGNGAVPEYLRDDLDIDPLKQR